MIDPYTKATSPLRKAWAIVPHNTQALSPAPEWVYVNSAGTVVCRPVGSDTDVTFEFPQAGFWLVVAVTHIRATGTTAKLLGMMY